MGLKFCTKFEVGQKAVFVHPETYERTPFTIDEIARSSRDQGKDLLISRGFEFSARAEFCMLEE